MTLYQEGPRDAKILICGEAPGATEKQTGRPFCGYSGDMLTNMLGRACINRHECFVTNLCHVQPPGNDFDWFLRKENQVHYLQGVLQLKKDIETIKPNLVIALGANPLRALTNKRSISDWRGSILESTLIKGQKVIGTYHPAAILRIWDYKAIAEFDLRRCAEEAKYPELNLPKREFFLNPTADKAEPIVREMEQAEWLAFDIETAQDANGKINITCIGFSDRCDRALVLAFDSLQNQHFARCLLQSPAKKICQNGNIFDVPVLRDNGYEVRNYAWDTMLGHHSLFPESAGGEDEMSRMEGKKKQAALRKGLAFQTSIYTREPRYKDDGKMWHLTGDLQMFWRYNGLDAAVTREIKDVQERELAEFGTLHVLEHEMALTAPLMEMTRTGIKIDQGVRERTKVRILEEVARLEAFLNAGAGQTINAASSKQVQELMYGKLGLPPKRNKKTGNPTANKDAINELAAKYHHPLLLSVLKIRERRKMVETYLNAPIDSDGRMRCSFDVTGTRSGRLSSRGSLSGSGTNLQNIPIEMREMFIADDGCVFVTRDFSQAEARVVAALANDEYLLELFADPKRDVHKETAAAIYGIAVGDVTPIQRYTAKRVRHAVNYGMDAKRFVEVVNEDAEETGIRIDLATARRVIDGFFLLHPNHKTIYWAGIERELKASRTLNTAFGRKRTFYGRMDDKLIREAYSYIPQSSVGDLCCKALVRVWHEVQLGRPEWKVQLLLTGHDSIMVQCPKEYMQQVADAMAECMDIPMTVNNHVIRIPTDVKVGINWKDVVDIEKWEASCKT